MIIYSNEKIKKFFVRPHIWLPSNQPCHLPNTQSMKCIFTRLSKVWPQQAWKLELLMSSLKALPWEVIDLFQWSLPKLLNSFLGEFAGLPRVYLSLSHAHTHSYTHKHTHIWVNTRTSWLEYGDSRIRGRVTIFFFFTKCTLSKFSHHLVAVHSFSIMITPQHLAGMLYMRTENKDKFPCFPHS